MQNINCCLVSVCVVCFRVEWHDTRSYPSAAWIQGVPCTQPAVAPIVLFKVQWPVGFAVEQRHCMLRRPVNGCLQILSMADWDYGSTVYQLADFIKEVLAWTTTHANHLPLVIVIHPATSGTTGDVVTDVSRLHGGSKALQSTPGLPLKCVRYFVVDPITSCPCSTYCSITACHSWHTCGRVLKGP